MVSLWQSLDVNEKMLRDQDSQKAFNVMTSIYCQMCTQLSIGSNAHEQCWNAHTPSDLRRPPFGAEGGLAYLPLACSNDTTEESKSNCRMGDSCRFAHTQKEILYHPLVYKTVRCNESASSCKRFECPFFHEDDADRRDLSAIKQASLTKDAGK